MEVKLEKLLINIERVGKRGATLRVIGNYGKNFRQEEVFYMLISDTLEVSIKRHRK